MNGQRFDLGAIVMTQGVAAVIAGNAAAGLALAGCIARHVSGDWGEVDAEDRAQNDRNLRDGERLFSVYTLAGAAVWIVTERDRSVTTALLPEEY